MKKTEYTEVENNSSLSMQIVLYFNVYLAPIWTISSIYYIYVTFKQHHSSYETVLSIIFLILAIPMEYGRLYLGYSGNLRERIPDMGGFLILSTFIQLPIQIYLLFNLRRMHSSHLQMMIQYLTAIFLLLQIIFGYVTIRRITEVKAQQFHVKMLIERSKHIANADNTIDHST